MGKIRPKTCEGRELTKDQLQDIEYHGSAVQFGLPPRLSARYNTPEAWVLCLRAYLDGGPSDRPADWNW